MMNDEDTLIRAARQLPKEIQPSRDLWPGILAGIEESVRPRRKPASVPWYYAMAAAIAFMGLGGLLTLALLDKGVFNGSGAQSESTQVAGANDPGAAGANAPSVMHASFGNYAQLGPEYEQARAQLAIGLAERIDRLPPAERAKIERNLAEMRRSLREINVALQLDPDNGLLQELLLSTYQQELAMLANVNQMAGTLPARTET
jgi:hypothetical protein